jgi:hypothetical protein
MVASDGGELPVRWIAADSDIIMSNWRRRSASEMSLRASIERDCNFAKWAAWSPPSPELASNALRRNSIAATPSLRCEL